MAQRKVKIIPRFKGKKSKGINEARTITGRIYFMLLAREAKTAKKREEAENNTASLISCIRVSGEREKISPYEERRGLSCVVSKAKKIRKKGAKRSFLTAGMIELYHENFGDPYKPPS